MDNIFVYQEFDCFLLYVQGNDSYIENGLIVSKMENKIKNLTETKAFANIGEAYWISSLINECFGIVNGYNFVKLIFFVY